MPTRQPPLPNILDEAVVAVYSSWSEDTLLGFVRRTATMCGWLFYHTRYSLKSAAGFPDLCLVHPHYGRVIFAELKRQGKWPTEGRLSAGAIPRWINGQHEWLAALAHTPVEVYLWWPSDCYDIATILADEPLETMECVRRLREYLGDATGQADQGDGAPAAAPVVTPAGGAGGVPSAGVALARAGRAGAPPSGDRPRQPPGG